MILSNQKLISSLKKMEVTGDKTEFVNQISIKILDYVKEPGHQQYEDLVSDVFIRFSMKFENFLNSYYSSGHNNLAGFVYLYIKNLFLNSYKENKNIEGNRLYYLYNLETKRDMESKIDNSNFKDFYFKQLSSMDRLILFLRYDIKLCEFDKITLKKILSKSNKTYEEIWMSMQSRRDQVKRIEQGIISKINNINYKMYSNNDNIYKINLMRKKKFLYNKLWDRKGFFTIIETSRILNISRYKVNLTLKKFKKRIVKENFDINAA